MQYAPTKPDCVVADDKMALTFVFPSCPELLHSASVRRWSKCLTGRGWSSSCGINLSVESRRSIWLSCRSQNDGLVGECSVDDFLGTQVHVALAHPAAVIIEKEIGDVGVRNVAS